MLVTDRQPHSSATIRSTTITGNSLHSTNSIADANAFSGGLHADGPIVLRDSTMSDNTVAATAPAGSANADSGAGEINADATIANSRFTGNRVAATSPAADAHASNGAIETAAFDRMTISDSIISDNRVTATTTTGSSTLEGGGIANGGVLTLRNTLTASPGITVQGGGLFTIFPVTQTDSVIAHNVPDQCYGC